MNDNNLKKKSKLKIWFESLIDIFREELKVINPENLDHLPHTYNFEFPCQIELFWLDSKKISIYCDISPVLKNVINIAN